MAKFSDLLTELKSKRPINIEKMVDWSADDFSEMLDTYSMAKEIAEKSSDQESINILNEKLSQVKEAMVLKSQRSSRTFESSI